MSFCAQIFEHARSSPEKIIIHEVHGNTVVPHTYQELTNLVVSCQTTLQHMGVEPGQRIGLLGQNSLKWIALDLALISLGCVTVPLNRKRSAQTLSSMMDEAKVSHLIFFDQGLADQIQTIRTNDEIEYRHAYDFFHVLEDEEALILPDFLPQDLATIVYSIKPGEKNKGAIFTRQDIGILLEQSLNRFGSLSTREQDSVFHFLPLCYASSRIMLWTLLLKQNPISLSTDLENLEQEAAAVKPHYFLSGPKAIENMYQSAQRQMLGEASSIQFLYKKTRQWHEQKTRGTLNAFKKCLLWVLQKTLLPNLHPNIGSQLDFVLIGSQLNPETQQWFDMLSIPVYPINDFFNIHGMQTFDHSHIDQASL
jgi:long-chain acyl-CoA synthetase